MQERVARGTRSQRSKDKLKGEAKREAIDNSPSITLLRYSTM
jgi:hypothetical protein